MSFFLFKQKTAYEMRISDWSSDVCSSDLAGHKAKSTAEAKVGAKLDASAPAAANVDASSTMQNMKDKGAEMGHAAKASAETGVDAGHDAAVEDRKSVV